MRALVLSVVFALGCSPGSHPGPEGGARLRPIVRRSDDGLRIVTGIHDRGLDEDCWPDVAADGKLRCLPGSTGDSFGLFADEACTKPAFFLASDAKFYVDRETAADRCSAPKRHVFPVIERPKALFRKDGTTCVFAQLATSNTALIGEEIGPDAFVEVHESPILHPVERRRWIGDDGSSITVDHDVIVDAAHGPCTFQRAADGALRCLPFPTLQEESFVFSDSSCTAPLLVANECADQLFQLEQDDAVLPRTHVFSAGLPTAQIFARDRSCRLLDAREIRRAAFLPGNELDPAMFPLGRPIELSAARLVVPAVEAYGEVIVERFPPIFDRALGVPCAPRKDPDGIDRCMPTRGVASIVFTDPACTNAVALPPAPSTGLAVELRDGDLRQLRRTTGATILGPAFSNEGSTCHAVGSGVRTLLALGERISFSALVAMHIAVE